ncbi:MAG: hypothetical protein ACMXYA_02190 [Candidatus Woesearchaeota archaeon]
MSLCDDIFELEGKSKRLRKPITHKSRKILESQRDHAKRELLKNPKTFNRDHAIDYIFRGLSQLSNIILEEELKGELESNMSRARHRLLPTYNHTQGEKTQVFEDSKIELEYGSVDDPLKTYADFLLHETGRKTYFGIVMRGLQDYQPDRFSLVDKVGTDIFQKTYGGFLIFTPHDDPSVDITIKTELPYSSNELDLLVEEHDLRKDEQRIKWKKLSKLVRKKQDETVNIAYKKTQFDKKIRRILREFPETGHIIGLPYHTSKRPEYFLDIATIYGIERK